MGSGIWSAALRFVAWAVTKPANDEEAANRRREKRRALLAVVDLLAPESGESEK